MTHYVTSWSSDKNYGKAINSAIEQLNCADDDWICLRDGDACFLTQDWGNHIQAIIDNEVGYDLIGCVTNRLRESHQLVKGMFDEMDLKKHHAAAEYCKAQFKYGVFPFKHDVAGFFMLFRYSAWQKNKFKENTPIFDRLFTRGVQRGRVGIAPGLYVLHLYRLWSNNPKNDSKHLM